MKTKKSSFSLKIHSAEEILKAGGIEKYLKKQKIKSIAPKKGKPVRFSEAENEKIDKALYGKIIK